MAGHGCSKNGVASLAYVPAIHVFASRKKAWMRGTSPRMTTERYFTPSKSTSKTRVAFGGMTPPAPRAP
jgi:hypothetical protein